MGTFILAGGSPQQFVANGGADHLGLTGATFFRGLLDFPVQIIGQVHRRLDRHPKVPATA
jgi:hypothetical protein